MDKSSPGRAGSPWRPEHAEGVALERNVQEFVDAVRCLLFKRRLLALKQTNRYAAPMTVTICGLLCKSHYCVNPVDLYI